MRPISRPRPFYIVTIAARVRTVERVGLLTADDARVAATQLSFEELYERHRLDIYRYLRALGLF